jgi:carbon monoxide dehydrogenase subunit G
MEFSGTQLIHAPRQDVWRHLNDASTIQRCIPGCEKYEAIGDGAFDALVVAAVGPIKATFKGKSRILDAREDRGYRLEGEGAGGMAGFGKLSAVVTLEDAEGGTLLHYSAEAKVGGKLAQIGSRLIQSVAEKFTADFFARFNGMVVAQADAPVTPDLGAGADLDAAARQGLLGRVFGKSV